MSYNRASVPTYKPSSLGGGMFNGISPIQSAVDYKNAEDVASRRILVKAWDNTGSVGVNNGYARVINTFRAVNSAGDFLSRVNYSCGGPNAINATRAGTFIRKIGSMPNQCDGTGVPAGNCHGKYVYDSSDFIRFKKLRAINQNFNDGSNGGDQYNASFVAAKAVRGGN